jgi:hypothetical protein
VDLSATSVVWLSWVAAVTTMLPVLHALSAALVSAAVLLSLCETQSPAVASPPPVSWMMQPPHLVAVAFTLLLVMPLAASLLWVACRRTSALWLTSPAWQLAAGLVKVQHQPAQPSWSLPEGLKRAAAVGPAMVMLLCQPTNQNDREPGVVDAPIQQHAVVAEATTAPPFTNTRATVWMVVEVLGPAVWHGVLLAMSESAPGPAATPSVTPVTTVGVCSVLALRAMRWALWLFVVIDSCVLVAWTTVVRHRILITRAIQHRRRHGFSSLLQGSSTEHLLRLAVH